MNNYKFFEFQGVGGGVTEDTTNKNGEAVMTLPCQCQYMEGSELKPVLLGTGDSYMLDSYHPLLPVF